MTQSAGGLLAVVVAVVALGLAPLARADGDPASDVLYGGLVFVPFTDKLSSQEELLQKTVLAAKRSGYPIKVAVIGGPSDLGAVPQLYAKPQLYARFLGLELRFVRYGGRLLVVMPNGFGIYHHGHSTAREQQALKGIAIGQDGVDGLAASGTRAVQQLAAADAHLLPVVSVAQAKSVGHDRVVIGAGALAVALVAVAFVLVRRRRA
jgi:hypothetical protein